MINSIFKSLFFFYYQNLKTISSYNCSKSIKKQTKNFYKIFLQKKLPYFSTKMTQKSVEKTHEKTLKKCTKNYNFLNKFSKIRFPHKIYIK